MGMITGLVAGTGAVGKLGRAAQQLSEVFVPNATEGQRLGHEGQRAALEQLGAEFALEKRSAFDRSVDALNRLPRPMLALGTLGLFIYAMAEPIGFSARMEGLALVPEPLWWLLGAIVGFYFGARELHYVRRPVPAGPRPKAKLSAWHVTDSDGGDVDAGDAADIEDREDPETGYDAGRSAEDADDDDTGRNSVPDEDVPEEDGPEESDEENPALAAWRNRT